LADLCRLETRIEPVNFVRTVQETRPLGAIILVKFQFDRCNVSPLRGEKKQNLLSKNNTRQTALRADLAGNNAQNLVS